MLQLAARALAIGVAVGTAVPVITGAMDDPRFMLADLVLALALTMAATMPWRLARPGLLAGFGYALGVFSIALAGLTGGPSPVLLVAFAASLAGLGLAALMPAHPAPAA